MEFALLQFVGDLDENLVISFNTLLGEFRHVKRNFASGFPFVYDVLDDVFTAEKPIESFAFAHREH
jgi:hypothetical protein